MVRRFSILLICLSLIAACGPSLRAPAGDESDAAGGPSKMENAAASVISYAAGGLPPLVVAGLGVACGWTVPVLATFAIGGAAYSLVSPSESPRAERVGPLLRGTSGAVRGLFLFPAMMGFASRKVYAPFIARSLHDLRRRG